MARRKKKQASPVESPVEPTPVPPVEPTPAPTPPVAPPAGEETIVRTFVSEEGTPTMNVIVPPGILKKVPVATLAPGEEVTDVEATSSDPLWRVSLSCPTPLAHTELVIAANNETEAREKFMVANGICGSQHQWTVNRLSQDEVEALEEGVNDAAPSG